MIKVELTTVIVEIVDKLTWGMREEINSVMMSGVKVSGQQEKKDLDSKVKFDMDPAILLETKYKAFELCVKKITLADGKEIPYTRDWMNDLSPEDGDKLFDEVNKVTNPAKK